MAEAKPLTIGQFYHEIKRQIRNPDANPATRPDKQYIYGGSPVSFRQDGVFPLPTNPKAANYPAGSAARYACDTFNYTYTSLLKSLDTVQARLFDPFFTTKGSVRSASPPSLV